MKPNYTYRAKIDRVIDGDTVVLTVDLGFRIFHTGPMRLHGIDSPERGKEGWSEAKAHLESLIGDGNVTIGTYKNPEKYGRWLCVIHHGMINVNDAMVEDGFATRY